VPLPESFWEEDPAPFVPRFFTDLPVDRDWAKQAVWPARWPEAALTQYAKADAEATMKLHEALAQLDDSPSRRRRRRHQRQR